MQNHFDPVTAVMNSVVLNNTGVIAGPVYCEALHSARRGLNILERNQFGFV